MKRIFHRLGKKTCLTCGTEFKPKEFCQKFCSYACSAIYKRTKKSKICVVCGKEFLPERPRNFLCSYKCSGEYRSGIRHNSEINSFYGYVKVYVLQPDGKYKQVLKHRHLMEQFLGRSLAKHEDVHHKNRNKKDNNISNLQVLSRSEHKKLHWIEDVDRKQPQLNQ